MNRTTTEDQTPTTDVGHCPICGSDEPPAMHAVMGHIPPADRRPMWLRRQDENGARDLTGQVTR